MIRTGKEDLESMTDGPPAASRIAPASPTAPAPPRSAHPGDGAVTKWYSNGQHMAAE